MKKRITLVQGQANASERRIEIELAAAYAQGAIRAGHEVHIIEMPRPDSPLASLADAEAGAMAAEALQEARHQILWADHLAIMFPLRKSAIPASQRQFLESVLRDGNLLGADPAKGKARSKALEGKSARVLVTAIDIGWLQRWRLAVFGRQALACDFLAAAGANPVHTTLLNVRDDDNDRLERWKTKLTALGRVT